MGKENNRRSYAEKGEKSEAYLLQILSKQRKETPGHALKRIWIGGKK